ncbi:hypothetical protein ACIQ34_10830 [Ureibacillus sp. NPDC094379]
MRFAHINGGGARDIIDDTQISYEVAQINRFFAHKLILSAQKQLLFLYQF